MTDERNTSYSSTRSDSYSSYAWPLSKSRPLLLETSPHYPSPPMTYPMYDESSALTPSYQGYSEVSQSSPTLFWPSHHILTPENKLYGHSNDNRDSLQYNHLIEQESFGKFYAFNKNNKAHVRFKSDGCFSSNRPMPRKFLSPPLPTSSLKNSTEKDATSKSPFQFQAILHSPVALMKRENQKPITYLNRGQNYLLELSTSHHQRGTLTSTISIEFHEPGHRKATESYWKFWNSQQVTPARAIRWDESQTTGVFNPRYPSFDKITFDWHGCFNPKIYIRFHCLSTDFSRIKGVKGIPLRIQVETRARYDHLPEKVDGMVGTFSKGLGKYEYTETCYCQIKIFRDKGAERKNKDDSKQMTKQMEKIKVLSLGNPEQHPLWPIVSQEYLAVTPLSEYCESSEQIRNTPPHIPSTLSMNKRKHISDDTDDEPVSKKKSAGFFFVWPKRQFPGPERIYLDSLTAEALKSKLSTVLSLNPSRITEIVWKKRLATSDMLVLMEDALVEEMSNEENLTVDWEIKFDNTIRLVLEFDRK